jgi:preprotein translocase subunit SecD
VIVAIGMTADTYIVLFERVQDETRQGRTLANAAPRSFAMTWRTIVAANLVALLSALILFWLSVGSVKGFALYVGLTTICDLLVCWFFVRPAVLLFSTSRLARDSRAATGVTAPIGAPA